MENFFFVHRLKCGIQCTAPQECGSLASHSQVVDLGNHCPEGCVLVTRSAVARRGTFIVDRVILRLLTHAHCLVAPSVNHCVVWCALLKQRTFARVCWRCFSPFFSLMYPHFRVFINLLAVEGQRNYTSGLTSTESIELESDQDWCRLDRRFIKSRWASCVTMSPVRHQR